MTLRGPSLALGAALAIASAGGCSLITNLGDLRGTSAGADAAPDGTWADASKPDGGGGDSGADASSGYAAVVLADAPIAYYRLGDAVAPTAKDHGPSKLDGVYVGGVKLGVAGAPLGDPDTAAEFDGADDFVEVTLPTSFEFGGKAPFTVEAWINRAVNDPGVPGILGKSSYAADAGYTGWFMAYNGNGSTVQFSREPGGGVSTQAPPNGSWFHLVATYDGVTLLLFVNGAEVDSAASGTDLPKTGEKLWIGKVNTWGRMRGGLDEIALYDKALPPARVKAHFVAAGR